MVNVTLRTNGMKVNNHPIAKGTCYVYIYAQNGIAGRVKVKVKK